MCIEILNLKVKKREGFRPFAPAVLNDCRNLYFDLRQPSPFMSFASPLHKNMVDKLPAINHVDDTARVQTVDIESNPLFYKLIKKFKSCSVIHFESI